MKVKIGRLAMREEDGQWVAYYAEPNTMHGAVRLGSVGMAAVQRPERKEQFLTFMRDVVADIIEEAAGTRPTYPDGVKPAPFWERRS